jgi:DNA invertase Pin-like site-specific DNA recombinase
MIGIYCRSLELNDTYFSTINNQKQKGIHKANQLGLPSKVYIDEGFSGYDERLNDRMELENLIRDVSNGLLTHVYTYQQSNFGSTPQILVIINNLFKKQNIKYITFLEGEINLADTKEGLINDILNVINTQQIQNTKIKIKTTLNARIKDGKSLGKIPYGYCKDENGLIIIDDKESEIVKYIYKMAVEGANTRTISNVLNEEGIQTRKSSSKKTNEKKLKWSPSSIRGIITNTFYKGERIYSKNKYDVPALFTTDYWTNANLVLNLKKSYKTDKPSNFFLLKGLITCERCHKKYFGLRRLKKFDNHYVCSSTRFKGESCGNKRIDIFKLQNIIGTKLILNKLYHEELRNNSFISENEHKIEKLKNDILHLKKINKSLIEEKDKAIRLVINGLIPENEITNIISDANKKIEINSISLQKFSDELIARKNSLQKEKTLDDLYDDKSLEKSFHNSQKLIRDLITNIILSFDDNKNEFKITIEYNNGFPTDIIIFKASDKTEKVLDNLLPTLDWEISEDDDFYKDFYFDMEDGLMVKINDPEYSIPVEELYHIEFGTVKFFKDYSKPYIPYNLFDFKG